MTWAKTEAWDTTDIDFIAIRLSLIPSVNKHQHNQTAALAWKETEASDTTDIVFITIRPCIAVMHSRPGRCMTLMRSRHGRSITVQAAAFP